jgi:hypothetical protein
LGARRRRAGRALRSEVGRHPYDRRLSDLIGELSTRSDEFPRPLGRARRALPPIRHQAHPSPGRRRAGPRLQSLDLSADDGLSIAIFIAEPGSATQQALDLLASWTATPHGGDDAPVSAQPRER